jgi:pimeloyl-ACP methyl ester carboxylesterase
MQSNHDEAARHRGPPGSLIDVGGRRVHVELAGRGSPCVVLEAGFPGGSSIDWSLVAPLIAEFATVLAYDRAGLGGSEPGPRPRTMSRIATELRDLIDALGLRAPFVLVGHSGGGLIVRTFREIYPDLVSGLVLVDPSHEEQLARIPGARRALARMRRELVLRSWLLPTGLVKPMLARRFGKDAHRRLPRDAFRSRVAIEARRTFVAGATAEIDAFEDSVRFLQARRERNDTPTIVLTAGGNRVPEWPQLQADIAARSRRSVHRTLPGVGHDLHLEAPDEVVRAVAELAVRASPVE